jgi:hypothetical protein
MLKPAWATSAALVSIATGHADSWQTVCAACRWLAVALAALGNSWQVGGGIPWSVAACLFLAMG